MMEIFNTFIVCSLKMSCVAAIFLLLTPILAKRYKANLLYCAWLLILIGFIIPVRPDFSLSNQPLNATVPIFFDLQSLPGQMIASTQVVPSSEFSFDISMLAPLFTLIWLTGVISIMTWHVFKYFAFKKAISRFSKVIKNDGQIKIIVSPLINSPLMIGLFKPIIYLPEREYTKEESAFILKHELRHFKRKDLWFKWAVVVAKALHWFNPVIYFMSNKIEELCELSCDEYVMEKTDDHGRNQYGQTILSVVTFKSGIRTDLMINFIRDKKIMRKRLQAVAHGKNKKSNIVIILLTCLLILPAGMALSPEITYATEINQYPGMPLIKPTTKKEIDYYAQFGIIYDAEKDGFCLNGEIVGMFLDRCRNGQGMIFLSRNGEVNIRVSRDKFGNILDIITFYDADTDHEVNMYRKEMNLPALFKDFVHAADSERDYYTGLGLIYDAKLPGYCYNGKLVGLFIDRCRPGEGIVILSDDGEINIKINRDKRGRFKGVEVLSDDITHEVNLYITELKAFFHTLEEGE